MLDFFYSRDRKKRLIQNTVMEFCDRSLEEVLKDAERNTKAIEMSQIKNFSR